DLCRTNSDMLRFTRALIAFRKRHPALRRRRFLTGTQQPGSNLGDVVWHGIKPLQPDFSASSRCLSISLNGRLTGFDEDSDLYLPLNAWQGPLSFALPAASCGQAWRRIIDTARESANYFVAEEKASLLAAGTRYPVCEFSLVVFVAD